MTAFPLTPGERRVLFKYCGGHAISRCVSCKRDFTMMELGMDLVGSRLHICPICRVSLEGSIRAHLVACTAARVQAAEMRERAEATRRDSQRLRKESAQARDRAEVLSAEAEFLVDEAKRIRGQGK